MNTPEHPFTADPGGRDDPVRKSTAVARGGMLSAELDHPGAGTSENARWQEPARRARFKYQRARMLARAERIRQMHAAGMSWAEMGRTLHVDSKAIGRQARALGLAANFKGRVRVR